MSSETGQQSHTQPRVNHTEHRKVQHRGHTERGASWKAEYDRLAEVLQERDYPSQTARAYTKWIRKFQAFTRSQPPEMLSSEDASAFLVWLPQKRRMTVSKLHQVYDALLLFFRHVLQRELEVERPGRASATASSKKKEYILAENQDS